MPVEAQTVEYSYTGDGVSTVFGFPSRFLSNDDLFVALDGVLQVAGFTITGAGTDVGGEVTFTDAPANSVRVLIVRNPPISQLIDFENGQTVLEGTLDNALDKLTMIAQYLKRAQARALRVSDFDSAVGELPSAAARAGKILAFDNYGNPATALDGSGSPVILASQAEAEAGVDNAHVMTPLRTRQAIDAWPFQSARAGALPIILSRQLDTIFSVRQLGAVGDGTTDDSAAFNKISAAGGTVVVPRGTYRLRSSVTINAPVKIVIEPGTVINVDHDGAGFLIRDCTGVDIEGYGASLFGNRTADEFEFGADGIRVGPGVVGLRVRGLNIERFKRAGIYGSHSAVDIDIVDNIIGNCTYAGIMFLSVLRVNILYNRVFNITPGFGGAAPRLNAYGISVTRDNSSGLGIFPASRDWLIMGNRVSGVPSYIAIDTHGGITGIVTHNITRDTSVGINLRSADTGDTAGDNPPGNLIVAHNMIYANAPGAGFPIESGVRIAGGAGAGNAFASAAKNLLIQGNLIDGFGTLSEASSLAAAMSLDHVYGAIVSDNTFSNCRYKLMLLARSAYAVDIKGNMFRGVATVDGINRAISCETQYPAVKASGNSFVQDATAMNAMYIIAPSPGFTFNVARDNLYQNAVRYEGSSASNRVDLGATAA